MQNEFILLSSGRPKKHPAHEERAPHSPTTAHTSRKMWKNMKNPSKKDLQNGNVSDIMINGLFSKGVKRRESKIFRKTDLRKM